MDNIVYAMVYEIYRLFIQMAPYLLFGFVVAGLLYVLIPRSLIIKHLKPHKTSSIFKAALLGVPLPLCSCGVIPVAAHLRKQGANKSATVSFLASTPSTGADSIFATYSLMGPVYTIFRPIDALFSGFLAGVLVKIFDHEREEVQVEERLKETSNDITQMHSQAASALKIEKVSAIQASASSCCSSEIKQEPETSCCSSKVEQEQETSCCSSKVEQEPETSCCSSKVEQEPESSCCSSKVEQEPETSCCSSKVEKEEKTSCCSSEVKTQETSSCCSSKQEKTAQGFAEKLKTAFSYGLFELVDDTKKWILIGIVIGGILSWGIPDGLTSYWIEYPVLSYLSMLVVGLPMYVCATASIPIATALLMNGLSPGAALVFLAVGPATNTATIAFLSSSMGRKSMFIYLFSISFSAILLGLIIDIFFGSSLTEYFQHNHQHEQFGFWSYLFSAVLAGLIAWQYLKKRSSCSS